MEQLKNILDDWRHVKTAVWKLSFFGGAASSTKWRKISYAMAPRNSRINAPKTALSISTILHIPISLT